MAGRIVDALRWRERRRAAYRAAVLRAVTVAPDGLFVDEIATVTDISWRRIYVALADLERRGDVVSRWIGNPMELEPMRRLYYLPAGPSRGASS